MTDIVPGDPAMSADVEPLIAALRPSLDSAAFDAFAHAAHRQGLVFTAAYRRDGRCVGVATHRVLETSRGRLLFVDDLVTATDVRSRGVGTRLLAELENRARTAGCTRLELDSGVDNRDAHRFYHARRMSIVAVHFGKRLGS